MSPYIIVSLFFQIAKLLAEREEMKSKLSNMQAISRERSELERQLATAKEDLFQEQRRSRQKIEAIQEVSFY